MGWAQMRRNLLLAYTHSCIFSRRDAVHSIRQAPSLGVELVSAWPLWGPPAWAQPTAAAEDFGAKATFCLFFLNASSSEAMFLLKPLKELRAKRKGTHLCLWLSASQRLCVYFP